MALRATKPCDAGLVLTGDDPSREVDLAREVDLVGQRMRAEHLF